MILSGGSALGGQWLEAKKETNHGDYGRDRARKEKDGPFNFQGRLLKFSGGEILKKSDGDWASAAGIEKCVLHAINEAIRDLR